MLKINFDTKKPLAEEQSKIAFLREVEETMQQLDREEIDKEEGYEKLVKLMERKEVQQIIKIRPLALKP